MATKAPTGRTGVNNYGSQSSTKSIGAPQHGAGGNIKTTRVEAAATMAGHKQVNPGSNRKDPNPGGYASPQAAVKHAANSTLVGKKETGKD